MKKTDNKIQPRGGKGEEKLAVEWRDRQTERETEREREKKV
jgi:hypothetical protein